MKNSTYLRLFWSEDRVEPPEPEERERSCACECAVCGREIDDDDEMFRIDGDNHPICSTCFEDTKRTIWDILDLLDIDYSKTTGERFARSVRR